MSLPVDVLEGKYEVVHKLSEGGMGAVYKVRHVLLDEERVIKVIRPQLADSEELRERFRREARTAIRLRHPKVAELFDFSIGADGTAYIVMELIHGKTIQDVLRDSGPPPLDLTLEIAVQVLEALSYLHRKGYVHRDIAPDNAMLTRDFEGKPLVKLIDLGIAKRLGGEGGLTSTGMFLGKARYASPEQFSQKEMDQRSDLYSFGVLLYELLTGTCPIEGSTLSQLIAGHLFHPPQDFRDTDPSGRVAPELRRTVTRALAKDPAARMSSAEEFIELLRPSRRTLGAPDPAELEATLQMIRREAVLEPASAPSEIETAVSSARLLIGQNKFAEARSELQRVLGLDPRHSEALRMLAMVEEVLRHQAEADRQGVITRLAKHIEELLESGELDDAGEKLADAVTLYGEAELFRQLHVRLEHVLAKREEERHRLEEERHQPQRRSELDAYRTLVHPHRPPASQVETPEATAGEDDATLAESQLTKAEPSPGDVAGQQGHGWKTAGRTKWAVAATAAAAVVAVGWLASRGPAEEPAVPPPVPSRTTEASSMPAPADDEMPMTAEAAEPENPGAVSLPAATPRPATPPESPAPPPAAESTEKPSPETSAVETPTAEAPPVKMPPPTPAPPPGELAAKEPAPPPPEVDLPEGLPVLIEAGPEVVSPQLVSVPSPAYPPQGRGTARVVVAVKVDEKGGVVEAKIHQGAVVDLGFNESALETARKAKFEPATKDGVPGRMWTGLAFDFDPDSR